MDYMMGLDAKDRKPYFDMLSRLRLGDTSMKKQLGVAGKPGRDLIELRDGQHGGPRVYGFMDNGQYVVVGASNKNDQDKAILKAEAARKEYDELKAKGELDPKKHMKFHYHTAIPNGHLTVTGKHATEFADREGKPLTPPARLQDSFNKGAKSKFGGGRFTAALAALTTAVTLFAHHEKGTAAEVSAQSQPPAPLVAKARSPEPGK